MLTDSQRKTYQFICKYIQKYGFAPKLPEIAKGIGIKSAGVVHRYLRAISDEGLITITPHRHRGIELNVPSSEDSLPLIGAIAAGQPIEAIAVPQQLDLVQLLMGENRYALKVRGDSMIDEGILDGDIIVCEHCDTAPDGAIVVALIDNIEATLKRIKRNRNGTITLIPANARLSPQIYKANRVQIQGVLVGLIRMSTR